MISFIRGTLVGSDSESALIEVNGIGYRVAMSYHALSSLGSKGDEVLVLTSVSYTHLTLPTIA